MSVKWNKESQKLESDRLEDKRSCSAEKNDAAVVLLLYVLITPPGRMMMRLF